MAWFRRSKTETETTKSTESTPDSDVAKAASPPAPASTPSPKTVAAKTESAKAESAKPASAEAARPGIWGLIKQGLKRTSDVLQTDIRDLVMRKQGQLVEEWLDDLYAILIKTDIGTGPATEIRNYLATEFRARVMTQQELFAAVKRKFRELLGHSEGPVKLAPSGPSVLLVVGVNGSGKTTSIAKLGRYYQAQGKKVILGAGDTFRAGAIHQLTIWAERLGVEIVKGEQGGDPASVAHRTVARALETSADICIVDTAGRLQTQSNLMDQLRKIHRVISKLIPDAPHEVLLVLDATAGQNGISQAQGFSEAAGCTGIVLAKLDGTAKGGVVIPIYQRFKIPVKFVGVGETLDDLVVFDLDSFLNGLFGE